MDISGIVSADDIRHFQQRGYLVLPNYLSGERLVRMRERAVESCESPSEPWELESQLAYPGAPLGRDHSGGATVRRLLGAYQRDEMWAQWARSPGLGNILKSLFQDQRLCLSQAHHNCLMTKAPEYSSDTGWHQDIRYWSFDAPELITAWLALGEEMKINGGLRVIPGSHRLSYAKEQFDEHLFFRDDMDSNRALIAAAESVELQAGDVLLFDCKLLHCASRNFTSETKYSLVFTYHRQCNKPTPGSRSASQKDISI